MADSGSRLATQLERVLLPRGLPDVPGWALAALYEPAGESVLVGGDFYDWFSLPNGNTLFLVGDVAGKGPIAGGLAMSIRKALKGITWVTHDLGAAVGTLQQALAEELGETLASLVLLELTPLSGEVRLLLAGHPPPWLRRGPRYTEVRAPENLLLGVQPLTRWESVTLRLNPGDGLLLFTDGLTEARSPGNGFFGEGPFQSLLARLPASLPCSDVVIEIDAEIQRLGVRPTDDVIISALSFDPPRTRLPHRRPPRQRHP